MNKVMLIGNVGADPSVRYLDGGVCVAQVRLATTERAYTLQNGTQVPERTEWHDVIFWRGIAERVEKFVHKGDKLFIEGKIQSRTYIDKSGAQRRVYEIMAENMEMLTPKAAGSPSASSNATPAPQPVQPTTPAAVSPQETPNEELPF